MTDRSQIDEIKDKLNIVDVVREYRPNLKHSGRNYFALCPFHNEKTPSFSVNEEIQRYKCFGCGEAGDVINFIEKMEGVDFPKALELAAKKAGVSLDNKFHNSFSDEKYKKKDEVYKINRTVAEFYHYILLKHEKGENGREYANKRKLGKQQIKDFLIGYAPEGYENLKKYLIKKGYKEKDLVTWSLLVEKNGKIYDKFRKRLIFPVFNHVGDIVGFSGRVIDNNDIPKYLNSSETPVYKKSEIVYGLFQGKEYIRKSKTAILVEGNVDVPTAHKYGIKNIVAPMGTALTENQLKLIKRYADTIILSFDTDEAGEKAMLRAFEMTEKLDIRTKAIDLGQYKDLDDFLTNDSEGAKNAVQNVDSVIDNLTKRLIIRLDFGEADGKKLFIEKLLPLLSRVQDRVELTHYVQKSAEIINIDEKIVWDKLQNYIKNQKNNFRPEKEIENEIKKGTQKKYLKAEIQFIAFLLQYEFLQKEEVNFSIISDKDLVELYEEIIKKKDMKKAIDELDEDRKNIASDLIIQELGNFESDHEVGISFQKLEKSLTKKYFENQLKQIKEKIRIKEAVDEDIAELLKEQKELIQRMRKQ